MDQLVLFALPSFCSVADCTRPVYVRKWRLCAPHYNRYRRTHLAKPCLVEGCGSPGATRGWCDSHYQRWQDHGDPLSGKPSPRVARALDHDDATRTCCICEERKVLDEFPIDKNATLGRKAKCKVCHCAQVKRWYAENRERQQRLQRDRYWADIEGNRQRDRARYQRDKPKRIELVVEAGHRRRALLRLAPSDRGITYRALRKKLGDLCHYCREVMSFEPATGHTFVPLRATVEHLVPLARGGHHTWANTVLACWQCNVRKNDAPLDEWLAKSQVERES